MSQINTSISRSASFYSTTPVRSNSISPLRKVKSLSAIPASRQVSLQSLSELSQIKSDQQRLRDAVTNISHLQHASPSEAYLTDFENKRQAYLNGSTAKRAEARKKFKAAQQATKEALAENQKTGNQIHHQEMRKVSRSLDAENHSQNRVNLENSKTQASKTVQRRPSILEKHVKAVKNDLKIKLIKIKNNDTLQNTFTVKIIEAALDMRKNSKNKSEISKITPLKCVLKTLKYSSIGTTLLLGVSLFPLLPVLLYIDHKVYINLKENPKIITASGNNYNSSSRHYGENHNTPRRSNGRNNVEYSKQRKYED